MTCETPQEEIPPDVEEDLIENLYTAGSLVWARWPRFPWWPAMVCDSPDTLTYYSLKPPSQVPVISPHFTYSILQIFLLQNHNNEFTFLGEVSRHLFLQHRKN